MEIILFHLQRLRGCTDAHKVHNKGAKYDTAVTLKTSPEHSEGCQPDTWMMCLCGNPMTYCTVPPFQIIVVKVLLNKGPKDPYCNSVGGKGVDFGGG